MSLRSSLAISVALLVCSVAVSGCSRGCDGMDLLDGVSFDLGAASGIVRATACVESQCEEFDKIPPPEGGTPQLVRTRGVMFNVDGEREVQARLTVVDAAGRKRTYSATTTMKEGSDPNSCDTAYSGDVRLEGDKLEPR